MSQKVIILGGGIAGLSAAHELIERRFDVEIYELLPIAGGKARSFPRAGIGNRRPEEICPASTGSVSFRVSIVT